MHWEAKSKKQKSYIYIKDESSGINSLYNRIDDKQHKFFTDKKEIMIDTLDNYCKLNKVKRITLLKCDVEGHELEVLKGATECIQSNMIDYIQFEYGGASLDARTYLRDFYETLSTHYIMCKIYKNEQRLMQNIPYFKFIRPIYLFWLRLLSIYFNRTNSSTIFIPVQIILGKSTPSYLPPLKVRLTLVVKPDLSFLINSAAS